MEKGIWKNKPMHDKWSHCADSFRYFAVAEPEAERAKVVGEKAVLDGWAV